MSRDYLNKGHRVQDRTVLLGSVPEADPSLVTHGIDLPIVVGTIRVNAPYLLVVGDFDGGASPTAELEFWGYFDPPTAGDALQSNWQHLATVTISDVVGDDPTMAVFSLVGLSRYSVVVKSMTGVPTGLGMRELAISEATADALVSSGLAASGGTVSSVMQLRARSSLPGAGVEDDPVDAIGDLYGRPWAAVDDLIGIYRRVVEQNPPQSVHEGYTLADETDVADDTYNYYFSPDGFGSWAIEAQLDGGGVGVFAGTTMKFYASFQDDGSAADSGSRDYYDVTNDLFGAASFNAAAGASLDDIYIENSGKMKDAVYIKVEIVTVSNASSADFLLRLRQGVKL